MRCRSVVNQSSTGRCDGFPVSIRAAILPQHASGSRRAPRLRLSLEVSAALDSREADTVLVHNLSASGLLIETPKSLSLGQLVAIVLPEVGEVTATVVWQSEKLAGCRFDEPIPKAALSAASLRSPGAIELEAGAYPHDPGARANVPRRIARLRREQGLTRAELAERAGISTPSLWAWETGRATPRRTSLLALSRALGISEQELRLGGAAERQAATHDPDNFRARTGDPQGLAATISLCKAQIASAAGIDGAHVKIIIEL